MLKEVHPRSVAPNVKVVLQHPAVAKAQLSEVVPAIVAKEEHATGLEKLTGVRGGVSGPDITGLEQGNSGQS